MPRIRRVARGNQRLTRISRPIYNLFMNKLTEIESAIECLTTTEVAELEAWMEQFRLRRAKQLVINTWLERARGAGQPGVTTESVMALTRGVE